MYDGTKKYKAILLNDFDKSFMKTILDKESLSFFKENINKINVPITRYLIYRSLYDMVCDGNGLTSEQYVDFVIEAMS